MSKFKKNQKKLIFKKMAYFFAKLEFLANFNPFLAKRMTTFNSQLKTGPETPSHENNLAISKLDHVRPS